MTAVTTWTQPFIFQTREHCHECGCCPDPIIDECPPWMLVSSAMHGLDKFLLCVWFVPVLLLMLFCCGLQRRSAPVGDFTAMGRKTCDEQENLHALIARSYSQSCMHMSILSSSSSSSSSTHTYRSAHVGEAIAGGSHHPAVWDWPTQLLRHLENSLLIVLLLLFLLWLIRRDQSHLAGWCLLHLHHSVSEIVRVDPEALGHFLYPVSEGCGFFLSGLNVRQV